MPSPSNLTCGEDTIVLSALEWFARDCYVRGAFFMLCMVYLFVGIAIIADIFMSAIENITSKTKKVKRLNPATNKEEIVSERVWNQTVANLSLMAFGSAAPEILLATIEIINNKFEADILGPGTIVGASMFNTFIITAFCIIASPTGQCKQIRNLKVFWTSTFFSLLAYVWLYLILSVITPGSVDVTEALITLLMFPVMVICGFLADKGFFIWPGYTYGELDEAAKGAQANPPITLEQFAGNHEFIENNIMEAENTSKSRLSQWTDQMRAAFEVDAECRGAWPYFAHFVTFFWKVIFSFIPPPGLLDGWPTFCSSVLMIGILTALMGDLATKLGCSLGWEMHITSVTVVAVGTSMPDLFASRIAAKRDNFADNAIGNINGSNAFNVFLGLGFPWLCATIYHQVHGSSFVVTDLSDLAFSVQIFILFSVLHLSLMTARRHLKVFGRGELGGTKSYAYLCCALLVALWLAYIVLCIVR